MNIWWFVGGFLAASLFFTFAISRWFRIQKEMDEADSKVSEE